MRFQAQLSGVKTWYLRPPPECWYACHGEMQVPEYLLRGRRTQSGHSLPWRHDTCGYKFLVPFYRGSLLKATKFDFYWIRVNLGSDLWVWMSVRPWATCWDLTDVTLADEDTNSILNDNANRAIQGNEAMQLMQTGDQCKFVTIGSGASWWPNLQPIQMVPSNI